MERYARPVAHGKQEPPTRASTGAKVRNRTASVEVSDSLVDAALSLLEESGFGALTVRAVATRAEVAPMGVYSRFGSKDGLLETIFIYGFDRLKEEIDLPVTRDPLTRLRKGCLAYREFAVANPHLYHLMFEQMMNLELSQEAQDAAQGSFAMLVDRVQSAMDSNSINPGNSVDVAQEIWSAMHGAVSLEITGVHFAADPAVNFAALIDTLIRGLGGTSAGARSSPAPGSK